MKSFEAVLIEQCAPTLAGMKVANLFRYTQTCTNVEQLIAVWNETLNQKDMALRLLKQCPQTGDCLFYVYRKTWMERVLNQPRVRAFLNEQGYALSERAENYFSQLSERLCLQQDFPHEIGVFLGYPMGDVVGFIENKGKNYTCSGYWKVYENPEVSKRRFARYQDCTTWYKALYQLGMSVAQLIAAV